MKNFFRKIDFLHKFSVISLVVISVFLTFSGCRTQTKNTDNNYVTVISNYKKGTEDPFIKQLTNSYIEKIKEVSDEKKQGILYEEYKSLVNLYEGNVSTAKNRFKRLNDDLKKVENEKNFPDLFSKQIKQCLEKEEQLYKMLNEILYVHDESKETLTVKAELFGAVLSAYKLNAENMTCLIYEWLQNCSENGKDNISKINSILNSSLNLYEDTITVLTDTQKLVICKNCIKEKKPPLNNGVDSLLSQRDEIKSLLGQALDEIENLRSKKIRNIQNKVGSFEENILFPKSKEILDKLPNDLKNITAEDFESQILQCFLEIECVILECEEDISFLCMRCDATLEESCISKNEILSKIITQAEIINSAIRIIGSDKIDLTEIVIAIKELNFEINEGSPKIQSKVENLSKKCDKILSIYIEKSKQINTYLKKGEYTDSNGKKHKEKAPLDVVSELKNKITSEAFLYFEPDYKAMCDKIVNLDTLLLYCKSIDEARQKVTELEIYIAKKETLYDKAYKAFLDISSPVLSNEKLIILENAVKACEERATELGLNKEFARTKLNEYSAGDKKTEIYDGYLEYVERHKLLSKLATGPKKAELMKALDKVPVSPVTLSTHRNSIEKVKACYLDFLAEANGAELTQAEKSALLGEDNSARLNELINRYTQLCEAEKAAKDIISSISKLKGKVTLKSESEIKAIRTAINKWVTKYEIGLDSDVFEMNLALISNIEELELAENRLTTLGLAKKEAKSVISAINNIGEVVPNSLGEKKIVFAELLFLEWVIKFEIEKDESVKEENLSIITNRNTLMEARERFNLLTTKGKSEADKILSNIILTFLPDGNGGFSGVSVNSLSEISSFREKIDDWVKTYSKNDVTNPAFMLIENADKLLFEILQFYNELTGGIYYAIEKITYAAIQIKTDIAGGKTLGILYDINAIESGEAAILSFEQKYVKLTEIERSGLELSKQNILLESAELIRKAREVYNKEYLESKQNVYLFYEGLDFLETNVGTFSNLKLRKGHLESIRKAYFDWLIKYFPDFANKKPSCEIIGYGKAIIDSTYPTLSQINKLVKYVAYEGEYTPRKLLDFISDAYDNSEYGIATIENLFNQFKAISKFSEKWEAVSEINHLRLQWETRFLGGQADTIPESQIADFDSIKLENTDLIKIISSIKSSGTGGGDYLFKKIKTEYNFVLSEIESIYNKVYNFEQSYYKRAGSVSIYTDIHGGYDLPESDNIPLSQIKLEYQKLIAILGFTEQIKAGKSDTSLNSKISYINGMVEWGINIDSMLVLANTLKTHKENETNALLTLLFESGEFSRAELEELIETYNAWLNGQNAPSGVDPSNYRIIFVYRNGKLAENQMYSVFEIYEKIQEIETRLGTGNLDKIVNAIDNLYKSGIITINTKHLNPKNFRYEHPELKAIEIQINELNLNVWEISNYDKFLELKEQYEFLKLIVDEVYRLYFEILNAPMPSGNTSTVTRIINLVEFFFTLNNNDFGGFFEDVLIFLNKK